MAHRNERQLDIIDQNALSKTRVAVVGVGAIGRQVAVMLATMGVGTIEMLDGDQVDIENLGCQGHLEAHVGKNKAVATAEAIQAINRSVTCLTTPQMYEGPQLNMNGLDAVFSCVDQMEARGHLFGAWEGAACKLFVDGRMNAMTCRAISAAKESPDTLEYYRTTLFEQGDQARIPCTAKATFYNASIAAGLMVAMFVNRTFLKMKGSEKDVLFNIPAFMLSVDCDKNDAQENHQGDSEGHLRQPFDQRTEETQRRLMPGTHFSTISTEEGARVISPCRERLPSAGSVAEMR